MEKKKQGRRKKTPFFIAAIRQALTLDYISVKTDFHSSPSPVGGDIYICKAGKRRRNTAGTMWSKTVERGGALPPFYTEILFYPLVEDPLVFSLPGAIISLRRIPRV